MIRPLAKQPSKPFRSDHAEQIKLVKSFDWLDLAALEGIEEEFSGILSGSTFVDAGRKDALCFGLHQRIGLLGDHVRSQNEPLITK
jgi:hypothetical protein